MAAVTRLGLYGGPRGLYGSFAGKEEQVIVEVEEVQPTGGWLRDPYQYDDDREERIRQERIRLGILPEDLPEVESREPIEARDSEYSSVDMGEVSRLISALEGFEKKDRLRKLAAILLLAA